jgi:hypothetical protein
MKKKAWYSRIEFRPDPSEADKNAINLGFLLEFTREDYWAVAMVMLAALEDSALAGLDDLSKKLIENRETVIAHEVRRIVPQAKEPGQALALLAAANGWSIHIDAPTVLDISSVHTTAGASAEKIAEGYALSLFEKDHHGQTKKTRARKATTRPKLAAPRSRVIVPDYCPPPWLSTQCVFRPLEW